MEVAPSFIILKQEKLKLCLEQLPLHEDPWQKNKITQAHKLAFDFLQVTILVHFITYYFIINSFIIVSKSVKKYCRLFSCNKVALDIEKQIAVTL